jgi:hypothetical protein
MDALERLIPYPLSPSFFLARNQLTITALGRCLYELGRAGHSRHSVRLDQCIQRKRSAGFSLTPAAMTAVHEQGARSPFDSAPVCNHSRLLEETKRALP